MSYHGTWQSTQYGAFFANGQAWVVIDKNNENADFTLLYTGTYQYNLVRKLSATVKGERGSIDGVLFQLKGVHDQRITFTAEKWDDNEIRGRYSCDNPMDNGTFSLQAGRDEPPAPRAAGGGCNIM